MENRFIKLTTQGGQLHFFSPHKVFRDDQGECRELHDLETLQLEIVYGLMCRRSTDCIAAPWIIFWSKDLIKMKAEALKEHTTASRPIKALTVYPPNTPATLGEVMDLEESKDDLFARKRICIKTKQEDNILEKFKIIVKGKNFVIRAKELFAWSPVFNEVKEVEYCTDDESVQGVSDTYFGKSQENLGNEHNSEQPMNDKEKSQDPFNIYDLLRKRDGGVDTLGSNTSIPYPPGFTPEKLNNNADVHEVKDINSEPSERRSEDLCSRVLEEVQHTDDLLSSGVHSNAHMPKKGGSVLEVLDEIIKVGQTMGYTMEGCMKDMENIIGSQGAQDVNFLSLQETKMESISDMDVKILWGNSNFEYLFSEAIGNSGGILCTWDPNIFLKEQHILSDNFVALFVTRCQGDSIVMGDLNEVRSVDERMGSVFNIQGAADFNDFISNSGLVDIQLEGYSFTWSHPSASKMSKLDRFLVTEGVISLFPHISAICLDRHLSDHRPILLRDVIADYGATPFRLYHSWLTLSGFEQLVIHTWNSTVLEDSNGMVRFKKKLQVLKKAIREWVAVYKRGKTGRRNDIKLKLSVIDKQLDQGRVNDDILLSRMGLMKQLLDSNSSDAIDNLQKAKIQWAIEGDENSKFFHGVINRKRANLAIRGVMVDGEWVDDPRRVKEEFCSHFATRFHAPSGIRNKINFLFPNQLSSDQAFELEKQVSTDEIRTTVWACGENKSPGPDGFTFEFFRKFWDTIGPDLCLAVEWFFDHGSFSRGCNSSFIALIPKVQDPKFVNDYRPISLIGSLYKVVTKILALRLSSVIAGLISDVQTAFLPSRQILDGPFVINELLSWCKYKKQHAMIFKVDFAKAYDSVRWDFLDDVLQSFGFGFKWRSWILGSLSSGMASVLINGSPTAEFQFHCGLKQGDPLAPYLFILVMESLHLSFSRVVDAGIFKGIKIDNSTMISHLFYADDAVFVGEWSDDNLSSVMHALHCFSLALGLKINVKKSHLLGVDIHDLIVVVAASTLGCSIMKTPFKYLGVTVGGNMSKIIAWDDIISKLNSRLSKQKVKTLSIGGRLTLLKSVLGSIPIYWMSLYKVPKSVLNSMEAIRRNFFNGAQDNDKKITWVWRYISHDNSLWYRVISAIHGPNIQKLSSFNSSIWNNILKEVNILKGRGVDLISHCKRRVGNGMHTRFWSDVWLGDQQLRYMFPRIYALEENKECSIAVKLQGDVEFSLRRQVRGGVEAQQLVQLQDLIGSSVLVNAEDRWFWDLNENGVFCVKDVRKLLYESFLPKEVIATRWIKFVPIKINVFAWKVSLDRLPTRVNLIHR
ncbi:RNA-directed DNA polymerase, eukaryota, partial [Tanacetum coccineum]